MWVAWGLRICLQANSHRSSTGLRSSPLEANVCYTEYAGDIGRRVARTVPPVQAPLPLPIPWSADCQLNSPERVYKPFPR